MQSLLEVNSGLMVVPKPTTLSMVPGGRLFNATAMASCKRHEGTDQRLQTARLNSGWVSVQRVIVMLPAAHLHAADGGATHAAAAVNEEQQFSGGFVQLQRFPQQVGTEVEHQDGAAQDVLVVSLPHKLQLQAKWKVSVFLCHDWSIGPHEWAHGVIADLSLRL